LLLLILLLFSAAAHGQAAARSVGRPASPGKNSWTVRWEPAKLVNGAPVLFRVRPAARLKSLSARWLGHPVYFDYDQPSKTWYGLAGVSLETRPGDYPLELEGAAPRGGRVRFQRRVAVRRMRYPAISLTVAQKYVAPDPEILARVEQEKALKQEVFARSAPEREWAGKFAAPVEAAISDQFGTQRKFNGVLQSSHQGLDYGAPAGTPVAATNRGTVLLARDLFYEGNCVVVDHGQGLLTLYLHLSEIKVKEGERVRRGQELGLSGASGRATGPHLHVAVRWQGVYLNPATLLRLRLPSGAGGK
jgi:murein DD-endopeptidase MepM/ murein hydrolase activator NlpD